MGTTPRERLTQLPLPTRSTEASGECYGRTVLSYLRADEVRPASFFELGSALHLGIEGAIRGLDYDKVMDGIVLYLDPTLRRHAAGEVILSGMQRSVESMVDDAERMITNWFAHVHPDSDKRHPIYDEYQWPPTTEVPFYRTDGSRYPVWGSVDAIFVPKVGERKRIVDWKSGVKKPDSDFQLHYYRYGLHEYDADAHYHMLDRIRKSSIVVEAEPFPGVEVIQEAVSVTERQKDTTLKGQLPVFRPDWYCGYCPVQHICPADGDPRNRDRNERELIKLLKGVEAMPSIDLTSGSAVPVTIERNDP